MSPRSSDEPARAPVLAVTVNYRTPELTLRCLASLAVEGVDPASLRAVVVDNASGDGSPETISAGIRERGWGSWVELLPSPRNGGFAAGNNLAVARALGEGDPARYFLLVNPDVVLEPGALGALVAFLDAHPRVGIAGPRTEIGRGNLRPTAFRFPGILNNLDEGAHFAPLSRCLARWQLAPPIQAAPHRADWVSGGCMLVRREVFETVGLMDVGFFLYFEEVDFCARAAQAGWECWFVPEASIVHDAGASTGATGGHELAREMPRYWFESRRRYFLKHRSRSTWLAANVAWVLGSTFWNLRRALTRQPRRDPLHFYRDFVRFNFLRGGRKAA
jgi:GT2 family glycosyltransferase